MSKKIIKQIVYILVTFLVSILIFILPLSNDYILMLLFCAISLYLATTYYNDKNYPYLRQIYILWMLVASVYNIFNFSLISIIATGVVGLLLIVQYIIINFCKNKKLEKLKEEIKLPVDKEKQSYEQLSFNFDEQELEQTAKDLYLQMQQAFMDFDYDTLKEILNDELYRQFEQQMQYLEKNNRVAVRENIDIFDFQIIKFNSNNLAIVKLGVHEDKYTKAKDGENKNKGISYETYYEMQLLKKESYTIDKINFIYSHSYKKS